MHQHRRQQRQDRRHADAHRAGAAHDVVATRIEADRQGDQGCDGDADQRHKEECLAAGEAIGGGATGGGLAGRVAPVGLIVSRLLKSCATPPVSWPTVSIFCDCRKFHEHRWHQQH